MVSCDTVGPSCTGPGNRHTYPAASLHMQGVASWGRHVSKLDVTPSVVLIGSHGLVVAAGCLLGLCVGHGHNMRHA
jgi:hypothetical protein